MIKKDNLFSLFEELQLEKETSRARQKSDDCKKIEDLVCDRITESVLSGDLVAKVCSYDILSATRGRENSIPDKICSMLINSGVNINSQPLFNQFDDIRGFDYTLSLEIVFGEWESLKSKLNNV